MSKAERKARYRARRNERDAAAINAHRLAGHCCGNCRSFDWSFGPEKRQRICSMHSDYRGTQLASSTGLCTDWRPIPDTIDIPEQTP